MFSRNRRRNGYALSEFLISLAVLSFLMPLITAFIAITTAALKRSYDYQDSVAIGQLRQKMNCASNITLDGNTLLLNSGTAKEQQLTLINNHLVLKPGTQIYLTDLQEASFSIENGLIYLSYFHYEQREETKVCIGHQNTIADSSVSTS